jgi:hypothetical protein
MYCYREYLSVDRLQASFCVYLLLCRDFQVNKLTDFFYGKCMIQMRTFERLVSCLEFVQFKFSFHIVCVPGALKAELL